MVSLSLSSERKKNGLDTGLISSLFKSLFTLIFSTGDYSSSAGGGGRCLHWLPGVSTPARSAATSSLFSLARKGVSNVGPPRKHGWAQVASPALPTSLASLCSSSPIRATYLSTTPLSFNTYTHASTMTNDPIRLSLPPSAKKGRTIGHR